MMCVKCICRIKPGQLYVVHGVGFLGMHGPIHVSCPTEREIELAERWGRQP